MKKQVYVLKSDVDYTRVFTELDTLIDVIVEDFAEEYFFLKAKEVKKHIKKREKEGYFHLFFPAEIDSTIDPDVFGGEYDVMKCDLE